MLSIKDIIFIFYAKFIHYFVKIKYLMRILNILLMIGAFFVLFACTGEENDKTPPVPTKNIYGIYADSLLENVNYVKSGQTLSDILFPHKFSAAEIINIANFSRSTFNVREIKPGKKYITYNASDSTNKLLYFIYEKDLENYVVFDFKDSLIVYNAQKETFIEERIVSGAIRSSLYQTFQDINEDINIALKLADIYAWQIDFWAIQPGDSFKVVFDQKFLEGKPIGIEKVKAAFFLHRKSPFFAFNFTKGDEAGFFDELGNSLQKAFLKAPLKFSRISSRFSNNRFHPVLRRYRAHHGIDYAAPTGTPVSAVGDGTVIFKGYKKGEGNYIKIKHNRTFQSGYMHLSRFGKGISVGARVKQGQVVGYVGSTGLSTGPHLDFRFWKNGSPINYLKMEFPPTRPIDKKYLQPYYALRDSMMTMLDSTQAIKIAKAGKPASNSNL